MTLHLDDKKTWSLATTAFSEIHGVKQDSDTKVGQILTLEGGLGKSYLGGGLVVGAAYYVQWKLTADSLGMLTLPGGATPLPELDAKHKVFAAGPDVTLPVASKASSMPSSTFATSGSSGPPRRRRDRRSSSRRRSPSRA